MASKSVSPTMAGKIAHRSMAIEGGLEDAAPLIDDALNGELAPEVAEAVISPSFDPGDYLV